MPSFTFVLPHWVYWGTLLVFPLVAMYMVARQRRLGTKTLIERGHHGPGVDQTAADSGKRRRDDIAHPLVSVGGQEPRVSYRGNQIW